MSKASAKAKAAIAQVKDSARKRYASIRESEKGRMATDTAICTAAGLGSAFVNGAYSDASMEIAGIDVPYTAMAGAAAMVFGAQTGRREIAAAGYGAIFEFGCSFARQAGADWADS